MVEINVQDINSTNGSTRMLNDVTISKESNLKINIKDIKTSGNMEILDNLNIQNINERPDKESKGKNVLSFARDVLVNVVADKLK